MIIVCVFLSLVCLGICLGLTDLVIRVLIDNDFGFIPTWFAAVSTLLLSGATIIQLIAWFQ